MQLPKFELKESINGNVFPGCSEFHILTLRSERAELVTLLSRVAYSYICAIVMKNVYWDEKKSKDQFKQQTKFAAEISN